MPKVPQFKLKGVPFTGVKLNDKFWSPRIETCRRVSIPHALNQLRVAKCIDALKGQWKPGDQPVPHIFWDSDIAKWLEAACYSLHTHPDPELKKNVDEIIDLFAKLQLPDGYLNSHYIQVEPQKRFTNLRDCHELYCAGHLIEAAVAHFRATGERKLLDVMCRYVDLIDATFGREPGKKRGYCGHEEIELALVKLYHVTGDPKHLKLSKYFIDERGQSPLYFEQEAIARGEDPKNVWRGHEDSIFQAHMPVRDLKNATGHAVRMMYLLSGMADCAAETGDESLLKACDTLWESTVNRRMYITGGVGSRHGGEAFGDDYELPNDSAYAETCAAIGFVFWAHRMFHLTGDAKYADAMERALYNGVLAGVGMDGTKFFYVNPLSSDGNRQRSLWFGCACCPTNVVRFFTSLGGYMYSTNESGVCVNLYASGEGTIPGFAKLTQETDYPWSGDIKIAVNPEREARFTIGLRIPNWSPRARVKINGKAVSGKVAKGYLALTRRWQDGDAIELSLAMPVHLVSSNPQVFTNLHKVAIQRGPLIYCLEQHDNPADVRTIRLPKRPKLTAKFDKNLLGGLVKISGKATATTQSGWKGVLYRTSEPQSKPASFTAIPYYAWANRKPVPMVVWVNKE